MGFTEVQQLEDRHGTIGYWVRFLDDDYTLVAKEYAYNDLASFIARVVVESPEGMDFIFYNNDDDSFTVFDGKYLKENSEESSGKSKKRDCAWRELPMECGADLHEYLHGDESPKTMAGENAELGSFA